MTRTIGVLTSGGDAPGMNACIRAVVRTALGHGMDVMGVRRGFLGLMAGDLLPLDRGSVANVIQRGGTILGTSRAPAFETEEGRAEARRALAEARVGALVLIGGDGTFRGAHALMEEGGPPCMGVPGTIDNDVWGTDWTIGFDTALNTALEAIDRIRDTAASHERLHFVEVMGRHCGEIAVACGLAGGAEAVAIPEEATDVPELCERIEKDIRRGKRAAIVVVAEGDETGGARALADEVARRIGLDARVTILGHIQRGGSPTAADRILGSRLGAAAVDALVAGRSGLMMGEVSREITLTPLEETWRERPPPDPELRRLIVRLA